MESIEVSEKTSLKTDSFHLIAHSNNNSTNSHWLILEKPSWLEELNQVVSSDHIVLLQ